MLENRVKCVFVCSPPVLYADMRSRPEAIAVRIVFTFLQWISYRKAIIISTASVKGLLTMVLLLHAWGAGRRRELQRKNANWFLLLLVVAHSGALALYKFGVGIVLQLSAIVSFVVIFLGCRLSSVAQLFFPTILDLFFFHSHRSFVRPMRTKMSSMVEFMWSTVFRSRHSIMLHDRRLRVRRCPFVVSNACRRWASMNVPETIWCSALKDNRCSVRNYCFFLICVATLVFVRSSYIFPSFLFFHFHFRLFADKKQWKRVNNGINCMKFLTTIHALHTFVP